MKARWRIVIAAGAWLGCLAAGWASVQDASHAGRTTTASSVASASTSTTAPPPAAIRAPQATGVAAKPVLYPHMILNEEEKAILEMTPEEALAKGDAGGAAEQHIARCREVMPSAPEGLCEKTDVTMHRKRLADLANLKEFLSGTLEPAKFQEQFHRNMLSWQLELESYMTYEQMKHGYPGIDPGDDAFLVTTAWGIALPPGYTMGEDILMRREGEGVNANHEADPRDPWTYGKKHGEQP